jgi:hypothetical protein
MRWAVAAALCAACSFDPRGVPAGAAIDAPANLPVDASVDAHVDAMVDADPCPMGYAPISGGGPRTQYRFVTASAQWLDAEKDCEDDGLAHLVVLDSDGERDSVRGAISGDAWVGVTDLVSEGTYFKVTTGVATYLPWLSGEPNNLFNEDCEELKGGGFNDEDCGSSRVYVCECDGQAANPVAYTPP